jgi:hypothetical protein
MCKPCVVGMAGKVACFNSLMPKARHQNQCGDKKHAPSIFAKKILSLTYLHRQMLPHAFSVIRCKHLVTVEEDARCLDRTLKGQTLFSDYDDSDRAAELSRGYQAIAFKCLVSRITGQVPYQDFTFPITAFIGS